MKKVLLFFMVCVGLCAKVSVSIAPQEFLVEKIAGDTVSVNTLVGANDDPHSYEPKPKQLKDIEKSDIYFRVGIEFEDIWVERLANKYKNIKFINTQEGIVFMKNSHHHDEHHHSHSHNDDVYNGKFDDKDVKDRELADWYGEWKSVYPYLKNGSLDEFFKAKAKADESKTQDEYKKYYEKGYKTDVEKIIIDKDGIAFFKNNSSFKSKYAYKGYKILTYKSGKKGVRFLFERVGDNDTPKYVQFSDHNIAPTKDLGHFHIFFANSSQEKLLEEMENWPTYYPIKMSANDVKNDLIHHISGHKHDNHHSHNHHSHNHHDEHHHHGEFDTHIWLDPINMQIMAKNIANALSKEYPEHKALYETNLNKLLLELDELDKYNQNKLSSLKGKPFMVYHPSWGYYAKRYGLKQIAVEIDGKEPKAKDLEELVEEALEHKIKIIFVSPQFSSKSAEVIAKKTNAKVYKIDQLSKDYIKQMKKMTDAIYDSLR